jgi:hypothetical protein
VGVDRHRIGALDPGQPAAQAVGCQERATPGGVDVEPQAGARRDIGAGMQRIEGARIGRSRGRGDHHRNIAGGEISRDLVRQRGGIQAARTVGGDQAQRRSPEPGHVRDLEPGEVALARGIEHRSPGERAYSALSELR